MTWFPEQIPFDLQPSGLSLTGGIAGNLITESDIDLFQLGNRNAGNTVELTLQHADGDPPIGSVAVVDGDGNEVTDTNAFADTFTGTLPTSGEFYAKVDGTAAGRYLLATTIGDTVGPQIVATDDLPDESSTVSEHLFAFGLSFDELLSPSSVVPSSFELVGAGVDGQFDTVDDQTYDLAVAPAYTSGTALQVLVADGPVQTGAVRFRATSGLTDILGNALDGDADSVPGGDFERTFSVQIAGDPVVDYEGVNNDELATATSISLNEDPGGSGFSIGRGIGSIDHSGDADWWSFTANAGDLVSVAVDSAGSHSFDSEIILRDSVGNYITGDRDSGPDQGSYISHFEVPSNGTYFVELFADSSGNQGNYQLRVERARGIDLESDSYYYNNSTAGADPVTLTSMGMSQVGAVGGTLMAHENQVFDVDYFSIGTFNAGNTVALDLRLPSTSSITAGHLRLLDADGNPIADEDGDPNDGQFLATLTDDGAYFAEVSAAHVHEGHLYIPGSSRNWADARAYAQSFGGDLVSVNDQAEQDFVARTFGVLNPWLGLNDIDNEGTHVWANGDPVTYTNWSPGEPNTPSWDGAYLSSSGRWFDYPVTSSWGVLAEVDPPVSTADGGPGPFAQYVLDVEVADTVPPQVVDLSRIPAEAQTTDDVIGSFEVTFSEGLTASTVNNPDYEFAGFNDHTYVLTPDNMTWPEAESYAQSLGGHLVTVNDQAEHDFLYGTFVNEEALWIGYSDSATEGTFVWADADSSSYTNWGGGYPLSDSGGLLRFRRLGHRRTLVQLRLQFQ